MPAGRREIEQGAATRAALVEAAPRLFVEQGHFATDKQDLFRGVFHAIDAEVFSGQMVGRGITPLGRGTQSRTPTCCGQ